MEMKFIQNKLFKVVQPPKVTLCCVRCLVFFFCLFSPFVWSANNQTVSTDIIENTSNLITVQRALHRTSKENSFCADFGKTLQELKDSIIDVSPSPLVRCAYLTSKVQGWLNTYNRYNFDTFNQLSSKLVTKINHKKHLQKNTNIDDTLCRQFYRRIMVNEQLVFEESKKIEHPYPYHPAHEGYVSINDENFNPDWTGEDLHFIPDLSFQRETCSVLNNWIAQQIKKLGVKYDEPNVEKISEDIRAEVEFAYENHGEVIDFSREKKPCSDSAYYGSLNYSQIGRLCYRSKILEYESYIMRDLIKMWGYDHVDLSARAITINPFKVGWKFQIGELRYHENWAIIMDTLIRKPVATLNIQDVLFIHFSCTHWDIDSCVDEINRYRQDLLAGHSLKIYLSKPVFFYNKPWTKNPGYYYTPVNVKLLRNMNTVELLTSSEL